MFDRICIGMFIYILFNEVIRTYINIGIGMESFVGTCALILSTCWIILARKDNFLYYVSTNLDRLMRWVAFPTFSFLTYQLLAIPGTVEEVGMFFSVVTVLLTFLSFWRFTTLFDEFHLISTKPGDNEK